MKEQSKMTKMTNNTWINWADSDGGGGLGMTTKLEKETATFMDGLQDNNCECGGQFQYRPTCGVMVCVKCGEIEMGRC